MVSIKDIFAKLQNLVFSFNKNCACVKCLCASLFIGSVEDAWIFADKLQEQIYSNGVNVEPNVHKNSEQISVDDKKMSTKISTSCGPSPPKEILKKATPPPPPPRRTTSTGTSPPPQSISTQVKNFFGHFS